MFANALAAFVGCFAALVVMAECAPIASKLVRYLCALVLGVLVTFGLAWVMGFVAHIFARV